MAFQKINRNPENTSYSKIVKWFVKSDETRVYVKDYNSGAAIFAKHLMNNYKGEKKWHQIGYVYYNFKYNGFYLMRGHRNEKVECLEDVQRGLSASQITQKHWEWYQAYMVGMKLKIKSKNF